IKLIDLNSTNGTKVEGKPIKEHLLSDGERVQIGGQLFRFIAAVDADEVEAEAGGELQLADATETDEPGELELDAPELDMAGLDELDEPDLDAPAPASAAAAAAASAPAAP